jgi:NAD(P)-dependent dehydrogenase (short-subunit alcohol dehydrogenase family)
MVENFTDLTDRIAVVVGGTSGLGRTLALGLARAGANVLATGRRAQLVSEVGDEIERLGRQTLRLTVDVTSRKSVDGLRDAVRERFGYVDILVNAAGRTARKPTAKVSEEDWTAILDTNLTGMLRSCQAFYELLCESGRGRIINIASLASFVAFHEVTAYGASKSGVLALTRSLGSEWARDRINVNAIVPGVFRTQLNADLLDGTERGRELLLRTPMGRFGSPEELVGATVFLASDAASFITGQTITIDGGFLASGVNS